MEPIEASIANSPANTTDPFEDAATSFIFGNGNTAADNPATETTVTPTATAATSQGSNSPVAAAGAPGAAANATVPGRTVVTGTTATSSSPSLGLILLLAGGAFVAMHFLHK
jgi:hypothetical protein